MRTHHQHLATSWIAGLACTLAAGCASHSVQPVASALRAGAADYRSSQEFPSEPVSVGYSSQPARNVTSAIGSVDFGAGEVGQYVRVEEMLSGRVAGLEVLRRSDGRYALHIRGTGSIIGNSDPLIVIDGMAVSGDASEMLASLSPRDVQRVDVLKDAGATAIYGSRGANGVIVITMKRAR